MLKYIKYGLIAAFFALSCASNSFAQNDPLTHKFHYKANQSSFHWQTGPWSDCDRPCETGIVQTRTVSCVDNMNNNKPDANCLAIMPKPPHEQECSDRPACSWDRACVGNNGTTCTYTDPICMTADGKNVPKRICNHNLSGAGPNPGTTGPCIASCPAPICKVTQTKVFTKWNWFCSANKPVDQGYTFKSGKYKGLKEVVLSAWRWRRIDKNCEKTFDDWVYESPGKCTRTTYTINASMQIILALGNRGELPSNILELFNKAEDSGSIRISQDLTQAFTKTYNAIMTGTDNQETRTTLEADLAQAVKNSKAEVLKELSSDIKNTYKKQINSSFQKLEDNFSGSAGSFIKQLKKDGKINYTAVFAEK